MPRPWLGAALAAAFVVSPAVAQVPQGYQSQPGYQGQPGFQSPQVYAQQEQRLAQFEDQIRQLTGRVEELNHQLQQVRQQLERAQRDTDFRLSEMERGGRSQGAAAAPSSTPPAAEPPRAAAEPPRAAPTPLRNGQGSSEPPQPGQARVIAPPGPGTTTMRPSAAPPQPNPPPSNGRPSEQAAAPRAPQAEGTLPAGAPQQQYDQAFALLARADYDGAERALKAFLRQHPNDGLAGNAQYWLGETYYVRQDYSNAAIAFGEGFQRYPKNSKAPDNLLKLGMSLAQINKKPEACAALGRLDQTADAPANVKDRGRRERQRLGC